MDHLRFVDKNIKEYKELIDYYKKLKHDDEWAEDRRLNDILHYEKLLKIYIGIRKDLLDLYIAKNKFAGLDYDEMKIIFDAWKIISTDIVLGDIIKRMANGKYYYNHKIKKAEREIILKALEIKE